MRHKDFAIKALSLSLALILCGCSGTKGQIIPPIDLDAYSSSEDSAEAGDSTEPDDPLAWLTADRIDFYTSVTVTGKDDKEKYPFISLNDNGDFDGSLRVNISPDKSLRIKECSADVYVFCDGRFLPHSVDGGELAVKSEITVKTYKPSMLSLYIPEIKTEDGGNKVISVIVSAMPDFIPEKGGQEAEFAGAYSFAVKTAKGGEAGSFARPDDADYTDGLLGNAENIQYANAERLVDIGYTPEKSNELGTKGLHTVAPVRISGEESIYVTYEQLNSEEERYAVVFIDNEPAKVFDGEYALRFSDKAGKRLSYALDRSALPKSGDHCMELFTLPTPQAVATLEQGEYLDSGTSARYRFTAE